MNDKRHTSLLVIIATFWAAASLPLGSYFTGYRIAGDVSLNLFLTATFFFLLGAILLLQRQKGALWLVGGYLAFGTFSMLASQHEVRHGQYLLTISILVMGALILVNQPTKIFAEGIFWCFSLITSLLFAVQLVGVGDIYNRATAPLAPIAILILLAFGLRRSLVIQICSLIGALALMWVVTIDTSRMASLIAILLFSLLVLMIAPWKAVLRVFFTAGIFGVWALYWILDNKAHERVFGRDATLQVGSIAVNGEGRAEAWRIVLDSIDQPAPESATTITEIADQLSSVALGHGVGYAGQVLSQANYHLDKPHNEFIRLFADMGIFGLVTWLSFLIIIFGRGIWLFRTKKMINEACMIIGSAIILFSFSLSDNILSYSWCTIPISVLLAVSLSPIRGRKFLNSWPIGMATDNTMESGSETKL